MDFGHLLQNLTSAIGSGHSISVMLNRDGSNPRICMRGQQEDNGPRQIVNYNSESCEIIFCRHIEVNTELPRDSSDRRGEEFDFIYNNLARIVSICDNSYYYSDEELQTLLLNATTIDIVMEGRTLIVPQNARRLRRLRLELIGTELILEERSLMRLEWLKLVGIGTLRSAPSLSCHQITEITLTLADCDEETRQTVRRICESALALEKLTISGSLMPPILINPTLEHLIVDCTCEKSEIDALGDFINVLEMPAAFVPPNLERFDIKFKIGIEVFNSEFEYLDSVDAPEVESRPCSRRYRAPNLEPYRIVINNIYDDLVMACIDKSINHNVIIELEKKKECARNLPTRTFDNLKQFTNYLNLDDKIQTLGIFE